MNTSVSDELLEQELVMRQCVERLESFERSHATFCSDLKDAFLEQVLPCQFYSSSGRHFEGHILCGSRWCSSPRVAVF